MHSELLFGCLSKGATMRNRMERWAWLGVVILTALASHPPARAQGVSIRLWVDPDIKAFFISDFHVEDPSRNPLIMSLTITNSTGTSRTACLEFTARMGEDVILVSGETNPFTIPPEGLQLSSQDISQAGGDYSLKTFKLGPDETLRDLRDATLATGMIPSGDYTFEVALNDLTEKGDCSDNQLASDARVVSVTNPFNLELLLPGQPFGEEGPEESQFPTFQWVSDACDFLLTVCKVLPGQTSGEDVMENEPVYSGSVEDDRVPVHSLSYPSTAEELMPGETYCWQVKSQVQTSGGTEERESEIMCFRVRSTQAPPDTTGRDILFYLQAIADKLVEYGVDMPESGSNVVLELDGSTMTEEEYIVWLAKVASGQVRITDIKAR